MNKRLTRQILYSKQTGESKIEKTDVPKKEPAKAKPPEKKVPHNRSAKITAWINSHDYFKWSSMCVDIGVDKGNFKRVLDSDEPNIHEKYIPKIIAVLKDYGYAE